MNTPNKVLMKQARETLDGKWGLAVKASLVSIVISILLGAIPGEAFGSIASFLIGAPITLGLCLFWLAYSRGQQPKVSLLFDGFNEWGRAIAAYFLTMIYVFLRFLLLIVPGIIAAYAYSQTFYILAEDKEIGINDAIKKSKQIMKGNKAKLFYLGCRFIGWGLLCLLTLGIGFIWLIPYFRVTMAKFYDDVKGTPEVIEVKEIPHTA